jgi:predicted acetyltransferase
VPNGIVHSDIYFLVNKDSKYLVGAIDIRHYLNEYLLKYGGNIGYGVRPSERQKGYATKMLALALGECKKIGMTKVLITCFKNNGFLENEVIEDGMIKQRYWIRL